MMTIELTLTLLLQYLQGVHRHKKNAPIYLNGTDETESNQAVTSALLSKTKPTAAHQVDTAAPEQNSSRKYSVFNRSLKFIPDTASIV